MLEETQLSLVLQSAFSLPYFYFAKNSETEQLGAAVMTCIRGGIRFEYRTR